MMQFQASTPLTLGVELELQLVNRRDFNLTRGAADLLTLIKRQQHGFDIKPEITESMLEIATGIHQQPAALLQELQAIRSLLLDCADRLNLGIAGGGSHPFQRWGDQQIFPTQRYLLVSELYGYLAKQFTVYGQHIHIGMPDGDTAVRMVHMLARYMPHFIALSASSPYSQGEDTLFQSARLSSINAFPLSGYMPFVLSWDEFERYFDKMAGYGIVASMKDFYWDIRPKPEYGTIEIRVCDTPLQLETAARLASFAQTLAAYYLEHQGIGPHPDIYQTYAYNRFQACRFGLAATFCDTASGKRPTLGEDFSNTVERLLPTAYELGTTESLLALRDRATQQLSDADWLRRQYRETASLSEVVRRQCEYWRSDTAPV